MKGFFHRRLASTDAPASARGLPAAPTLHKRDHSRRRSYTIQHKVMGECDDGKKISEAIATALDKYFSTADRTQDADRDDVVLPKLATTLKKSTCHLPSRLRHAPSYLQQTTPRAFLNPCGACSERRCGVTVSPSARPSAGIRCWCRCERITVLLVVRQPLRHQIAAQGRA